MQPKLDQFSTVEDILTYAMEEEKEAAHFYEDAANRMADLDLKKFLLALAEMEIDHCKFLKAKLEECKANGFSTQGILSSFHEG